MSWKKFKWSKVIGPAGWLGIAVDWAGGIGIGLLAAGYIADTITWGLILVGVSLVGHLLIFKSVFGRK